MHGYKRKNKNLSHSTSCCAFWMWTHRERWVVWDGRISLCAFVRQQILRSFEQKCASGNSTRSHLFNGARSTKQLCTNSLALRHLISNRLFSRQNIARPATLRGSIPRLIRILRVTESLPQRTLSPKRACRQSESKQHLLLFKWQLLFHSNYTCARD